MFAEEGMYVKGIPMSGHNSKMSRFLPFCTLAESGFVSMVEADWNEDFLVELEYFTGGRNEKNDQADATSDAFNTLCKQTVIPTFYIPEMLQASPIPSI